MSKSLLSYDALCRLVEDGVIDAPLEHVNAASIDLRIGPDLQIEDMGTSPLTVADPGKKIGPRLRPITMGEGGYVLRPGQFCLAATIERFNLPNDLAGEFKLRSSIARCGLNNLLAGWADPGFHGAQLTLELHNTLQHSSILLRPGLRVGQMVFWRCDPVPADRSYAKRGRYNGQTGPTESKGVAP